MHSMNEGIVKEMQTSLKLEDDTKELLVKAITEFTTDFLKE